MISQIVAYHSPSKSNIVLYIDDPTRARAIGTSCREQRLSFRFVPLSVKPARHGVINKLCPRFSGRAVVHVARGVNRCGCRAKTNALHGIGIHSLTSVAYELAEPWSAC